MMKIFRFKLKLFKISHRENLSVEMSNSNSSFVPYGTKDKLRFIHSTNLWFLTEHEN